jgi:hypothetical protein
MLSGTWQDWDTGRNQPQRMPVGACRIEGWSAEKAQGSALDKLA